jgi:hypothetical protein
LITTYQVKNVLRVYGNQLKKRRLPADNPSEPSSQYLDSVNISIEARRKQVLGRMSNNLLIRADAERNSQLMETREDVFIEK